MYRTSGDKNQLHTANAGRYMVGVGGEQLQHPIWLRSFHSIAFARLPVIQVWDGVIAFNIALFLSERNCVAINKIILYYFCVTVLAVHTTQTHSQASVRSHLGFLFKLMCLWHASQSIMENFSTQIAWQLSSSRITFCFAPRTTTYSHFFISMEIKRERKQRLY